MHAGPGVLDENTQKPEVVVYYNSTKGGVDKLDHLVSTYTVRRKSQNWPSAVFGNLVDIAGINP